MPTGGPDGSEAPVGSISGSLRRRLAAVVAGVLALAVLAAVTLGGRPPPIEERLPLASASSADRTDAGNGASAGATAEDAAGGGDVGAVLASSGVAGNVEPSEAGSGPSAGSAALVVHIAGAVTVPGVVRLGAGTRVVDAVTAAGGLRADADPDRVNLAAPLTDGQRIVVPIIGQPAPAEVVPTGPSGTSGPGQQGVAGPVDLNTADAAALEELPGVGPATSAAILAHREAEGPFSSVEDLIDVRGIGEAKLDALRDLVVVDGGS